MIRYVDECVGCPPEMGCLGPSCSKLHVRVLECDGCGAKADLLYEYDGEELCEDCLLDRVPTIK